MKRVLHEHRGHPELTHAAHRHPRVRGSGGKPPPGAMVPHRDQMHSLTLLEMVNNACWIWCGDRAWSWRASIDLVDLVTDVAAGRPIARGARHRAPSEVAPTCRPSQD